MHYVFLHYDFLILVDFHGLSLHWDFFSCFFLIRVFFVMDIYFNYFNFWGTWIL
jgi:hypothetical protein